MKTTSHIDVNNCQSLLMLFSSILFLIIVSAEFRLNDYRLIFLLNIAEQSLQLNQQYKVQTHFRVKQVFNGEPFCLIINWLVL